MNKSSDDRQCRVCGVTNCGKKFKHATCRDCTHIQRRKVGNASKKIVYSTAFNYDVAHYVDGFAMQREYGGNQNNWKTS